MVEWASHGSPPIVHFLKLHSCWSRLTTNLSPPWICAWPQTIFLQPNYENNLINIRFMKMKNNISKQLNY